jgi:hypothetical protein
VPSSFARAADGRFTLQPPKALSGSGADYAKLHAQLRAIRLADAGLASLESTRDGDGAALKLRLTPQIDELFAKHGSCLPVGETKVELVGIGTSAGERPTARPRIYARNHVIKPAAWTRNTPALQWLPELTALLQSGV